MEFRDKLNSRNWMFPKNEPEGPEIKSSAEKRSGIKEVVWAGVFVFVESTETHLERVIKRASDSNMELVR